jgi:hypothetical protein
LKKYSTPRVLLIGVKQKGFREEETMPVIIFIFRV